MDSKKPWESKTIIINAIMGIIAAVAMFVPGAKVVADFITVHAVEIGVFWSVLNLVVRAITKDKIQLTD